MIKVSVAGPSNLCFNSRWFSCSLKDKKHQSTELFCLLISHPLKSIWDYSFVTRVNNVLCLVTQSYPTLCASIDCSLPGSSVHRNSQGKNTRVGCHALRQGIFPIPAYNPGLSNCRWILYCLSHQGSPRILEWVAYHFFRGSSQPRNGTGVSCIAGRFLTSWATKEALGGGNG